MRPYQYLFLVFFTLLTITLTFCKKEAPILGPPEANFVVSPENGKTTTIFSFNAGGSFVDGFDDAELFFRWDWDGDGTWDTHFSKSEEYEYRFRSPGVFDTKMEVRNVNGLVDTLTTTINVERGNSAPFPSIVAEPSLGHIRTNFVFDASGTYDDEDSLNTLKFRWDWEGDGQFDTEYSSNPVIEHTFPEAGFYRVVMQVIDPWGQNARTNVLIDVTTYNPLLVVDFSWGPEGATTSDVITLDASASYDPEDAENMLQYRWDLNDDKFFDTEWLDDPVFEHLFKEEGENNIRLEIKDQYGLTKGTTKEIFVYHSNQPPKATFVVGSEYGNLTTNFYFDASDVSDDEDFFNVLQVRWDYESDGVYDTEYSMTKTSTHFYGVAGDYKVTMEVIDTGGLTDTISQTVHVSSGTNETDLVIDKDNNTMYGTVKIGNQWWTSENVDATSGRSCYRNIPDNCETFGGLYTWNTAMRNATTERAQGICPDGWHIPTAADWVELFDFLGEENARSELEVGGSTDFRMLYAGQGNPNGTYEYGGSVVNFWTSSAVVGSNAWSYSMQAGKDQVWKITLGKSYRISVRCIKN